MKLLVFLLLASPVFASKGDVSAPPQSKMAAAQQKGDYKPAPPTDKRVLQLQLKK